MQLALTCMLSSPPPPPPLQVQYCFRESLIRHNLFTTENPCRAGIEVSLLTVTTCVLYKADTGISQPGRMSVHTGVHVFTQVYMCSHRCTCLTTHTLEVFVWEYTALPEGITLSANGDLLQHLQHVLAQYSLI